MNRDKLILIMQKYQKYILIVLSITVIISCIIIYKNYSHNHDVNVNMTEMVGNTKINDQDIKKAIPNSTAADQKDIARLINNKQQYKADYSFYSADQKAGDDQAKVFSKDHNSKDVIKQTSRTDVPAAYNTPAATIYNNNYYAIQQQRKHDIKVGAVVIHDKAAAEISYRNRDIEYKVFVDQQGAAGGGVSYTVAKW